MNYFTLLQLLIINLLLTINSTKGARAEDLPPHVVTGAASRAAPHAGAARGILRQDDHDDRNVRRCFVFFCGRPTDERAVSQSVSQCE